MTALQDVVLDPAEVAVAGRREITLAGSEGVTVAANGIDWGNQEVKQFMAEGLFGSRPIDQEWPLRQIKLPLIIRPTGTQSFDDVRVMLEQWVAQANLEGGWVKRVLPSGRVIFVDIVEAKLHLSASWQAENRDFDNEATLELQALPDPYGPEINEVAHEGTGDIAFTMQVRGDMPARVTQMLVEDKSGNAQQGLMWHYRRRHYSSATTAAWAYNAEALGLLDIAEKVALTGSYGTSVVKHPKLSTGWTPFLSTGFLTHTGLCDVWARVYSTSEALPWLRLVYGVGDIVAPAENTQVQIPGKEALYLVHLGQVNIKALPFGAQRWEGVVQARGEAGGENISIDRLWFQCADESSGVLAALQSAVSLSSTVASDSLMGTGALSGSEANRGGKWEEVGSAKGGFTRTEAGADRSYKEDTEGRTALLAGSTIGPVCVQCEVGRNTFSPELVRAIYLRYFSSTFWVRVSLEGFEPFEGFNYEMLYLEYDAGVGIKKIPLGHIAVSTLSLLEAEIDAGAGVTVRIGGTTYRSSAVSTFKRGEAHAEGKIGIFDYNPSKTELVRTYSHLMATALPPSDAVMYANKAAYLSTQGMYRQSEDGLGAGPIGHPGSDLPRLPVSGPEEAPVEIAVKASRGQFGELADSGKDAVKVQVAYRPCYASIPES